MKKLIIALIAVISLTAISSCRYVNDARDTAFEEFKPSELLNKYEYFKEMSGALDKKIADIQMYDARIKNLEESYAGAARSTWARDDREAYNTIQAERIGIKASYNQLAADYNVAMAKFNFAFCNVGSLPEGAKDPLPKSYKPYIYE